MPKLNALLAYLKNILRAGGITYSIVSREFSLSEPSAKRRSSREIFTLAEVTAIYVLDRIEVSGLAKSMERRCVARLVSFSASANSQQLCISIVAPCQISTDPGTGICRQPLQNSGDSARNVINIARIHARDIDTRRLQHIHTEFFT